MDIKRIPVTSLDHALKVWEDHHFLTKMQVLAGLGGVLDLGGLGPVAHGDDFRQYLLDARDEGTFDYARFGARKDFVEDAEGRRHGYATLLLNQQMQAQALYHWSRWSRRVFHLPNDLTLLLQQTSLHTLTWGEVGWPFEAFAVTLETPINYRGAGLDCFVVHPSDGKENSARWITCFNGGVRLWPGLGRSRRKMYMRDVANRRFTVVNDNVKKDLATMQNVPFYAFHYAAGSGDDKIGAAGKKYVNWVKEHGHEAPSPEEIQPIYRIIGGLSQYLKSLPPKSPHVARMSKVARTRDMDRRSIIAEADVATVSSYYTLTSEESELLEASLSGKSGTAMCAHWRRGHWRRPHGLGAIPEAQKTVWVRPTLVRMDRLADGTLPGGSMQTIELPSVEEAAMSSK